MKLQPMVDFRLLFENLPGLYLILDRDFTIVAVSDAYLAATMTERTNITGRCIFDVFPDNPDVVDASGVFNLHASLNEVLNTGKPHKMSVQKYDIRNPEGVFEERFWSPSNAPVLNEKGEITYIIHQVVDITEQQRASAKLLKSENDYQLLVNSVKDYAIFMVDTGGRVVSWNNGAEAIKGYRSTDIIGQPINVFYTAEDNKNGVPEHNLAMAQLHRHHATEGWRMRKDGSLFWANIVISALKDEAGVLYGYSKITRDITEQRRLKEEVTHLASIVEQSSEAIISRDFNQRFISWNSGAEKLFGYSKAEAIGKGVREMGFTQLNETEIAQIEKQVREKGSWSSEKVFLHKNGTVFFGSVSAYLIKNELGALTSFVFIIKDISLRKQLEEQLKKYNDELEKEVKKRTDQIIKNEHLFKALFENSNDVIALMDESFNVFYRTTSAARIIGWKDEEILGANATQFIHPEDVDQFEKVIKASIANPGSPFTHLFRVQHKDGHYLSMEAVIINQLNNEYIKALVINYKDVSARIEAESQLAANQLRFKLLIENSADGIALSDENSTNLYSSPGALKITGNFSGRNQMNFVYPDDFEAFKRKREEMFNNPGVPVDFQTRYRHTDGHYFWVEGTFTNLLHVAGVNAIVTNFRDITLRKNAEEELKIQYEEKQQLAKRMSIILNTLPANIALLDSKGTIVEVNDAWRNFAKINGYKGTDFCIGDNYLAIAERAFGLEMENGQQVSLGIKSILDNRSGEFIYEYSCNSPEIKRWYRMVVTPLIEKEYAGAVVMHIDISEIRRLEEERLNAKMEEQKKVSKAILSGQEIERNYLGQELHDNINQILVGTKLFLGMAGNKSTETKELIKYPMELLDTSMEEIRSLCQKMVTPLKNNSLEELIRELINKFDTATQLKTVFTYDIKNEKLSDELKVNIYRIIQELFNNIHKYSGAKQVNILVKGDEHAISFTVTDDGVGFDINQKRNGVGISNMINRVESFNGVIKIDSALDKGCKTDIVIPY